MKQDGYWVFINDFSIQLGKEKCLLTLGIPLERMRENGFNVTHVDVEVLDIFVTLKSRQRVGKRTPGYCEKSSWYTSTNCIRSWFGYKNGQ